MACAERYITQGNVSGNFACRSIDVCGVATLGSGCSSFRRLQYDDGAQPLYCRPWATRDTQQAKAQRSRHTNKAFVWLAYNDKDVRIAARLIWVYRDCQGSNERNNWDSYIGSQRASHSGDAHRVRSSSASLENNWSRPQTNTNVLRHGVQ